MLKKLITSVIVVVICGELIAQGETQAVYNFNLQQSIEEQLPSLDSLIDIAISYHPTVKLNQALIGSATSRINLAKKSWSSLLRGYVDYGYGNQAIIATGPGGGDLSNIANGYRAGANLSIPLSEIYTRKDRVNLQKNELEATYYKTQEMELVIASQVVEEYNMLVTGQRLMKIRFEMQQKAQSNLAQMELEYISGNIDGAIYTRNAEIYTIAQSEYENARRGFMTAAQKLELLLGLPLSQLIK
ncbi:TolC family protein [Lunatibacter salilacus]|uniref:TolC family protein n=1 Tax=Lunatibacter salilacus TaxID=2483804 RepID=UPI00131E83E9|nr:TolC family protein [Lunatibacter salilacus]